MPISEDEFDHHLPHRSQHQVGMSKAEQRRSNKPIMEKRRRARINHCLNELKTLILDAMKKDPARHSKLEKADILEMTVKHLQTIQRQQLAVAVATDPGVLHKFKNGFNECATEVSRYIGRIEGVEPGIKQRLVSHLANCVTGLQQLSPFTFPPPTTSTVFPTTTLHIQPTVTAPASTTTTGLPTILPQMPTSANVASGDVNNNTPSARLQMTGGLQLIPSRLPTGELALLVPNSGQLPGNVLPFFPPPPSNTVATTGTAVTSSTSTNSSVTSTSTTTNPPAVPPPSTSTTIVTGGSHPSAFTAVVGARSQSPTTTSTVTTSAQTLPQQPVSVMQNLLPNKVMTVRTSCTPPPLSISPASSVSSCETSDTYGPSTPPPQLTQTHATFSSSLGQFKVPLGSPSSSAAFKVFHFPILDTQKPQQQPLVTSSTSPADIKPKYEPMDPLAHNSSSMQYQHPSNSPADMKPKYEPMDPLAHNSSSMQYQQSVPASSASEIVAAELQLAFKTLPAFEQSSPKLLTSVSQPVMTTVAPQFQPLIEAHPTLTATATTTVTSAAATATFVLSEHLHLSNPPLDFSIKKEPSSAALQSSGAISGKRTFLEVGNTAACSPNKMLRLSFVQSPPPEQPLPPVHKSDSEVAPVGLLKLYSPPPPMVEPKCTSQLSVVVEDLSNKPSSSSVELPSNNAASGQSQGSKDMWRPW